MNPFSYEPWPELPYAAFKSTAHLLHMGVQVIGKLKLQTPFEPHWGNVGLWLTSRGLTTGPIPYDKGMFSIDIDFIDHQVIGTTSWGLLSKFPLHAMAVADFADNVFSLLHDLKIQLSISLKPQEIADPIDFDKDVEQREYNKLLANAWWRILLSSYRVMQRYHARFHGESPAIALMWGTFDLRDARYSGAPVSPTGINTGYIRRNAMDAAQIEAGWWHGNDAYPRPAYYSFTYPQPAGIESVSIAPKAARWESSLGEFILDYDTVRTAADPEKELLAFFESTYQAGARCACWNPQLDAIGEPV